MYLPEFYCFLQVAALACPLSFPLSASSCCATLETTLWTWQPRTTTGGKMRVEDT